MQGSCSQLGMTGCGGGGQGCIGREGASGAAREAVMQAVGGGCQSGWGRGWSVTNAMEAGRGTVAGQRLGALEWGGGVPPPPHTPSTAPAHQRLGSANAETTPAGAPAAAADRTQRPTQHAKGRTGDCPGPRKGTATQRNITRGVPPSLPNASLEGGVPHHTPPPPGPPRP